MSFKNDIKSYYGQIKAGESLKAGTKAYLLTVTRGFTAVAQNARRLTPLKVCAAFGAAFIAAAVLFFTPTAEIGIDINPSLELSVNVFNRVVYTKGLNDDGRRLLSSMSLNFKSCSAAFEEIINSGPVVELLRNDEALTVTVSGINSNQSECIYADIQKCPKGAYDIRCQYVTADEYRAAHNLGLSCGKYRAYLYLVEQGCEISLDDIKNMAMSDIRRLAQSLSSESGEAPQFCRRGLQE